MQAESPQLESKGLKNIRFQELSVYEQFQADCDDRKMRSHLNYRPIYDKLFPYVRSTRKQMQDQVATLRTKFVQKILNVYASELKIYICCFKTFMTDAENLKVRQGLVSFFVLTGFHFGNRQNHLSKKLFFGTLGALFGGALCFPTETDKIVREVSYNAVTNINKLLEKYCGGGYPVKTPLPGTDWPMPAIASGQVCGRNSLEPRKKCTIR